MPRPGELGAGGGEGFGASEMGVDDVAANGVGQADPCLPGAEVGEGAVEVFEEAGIFVSDVDAGGATLPDSHEPDGVEDRRGGDGVPLGGGDGGEVDGLSVFLGGR